MIRELADGEDGRLAPQNNHLVQAWNARFFYGSEITREVKKQSKKIIQSLQMSPRMASLRQDDVLGSLP